MAAETDSQRRILVIDDEEVVHASLNRVLGRAGYQVQSCYLAREGLDQLAAEPYDLVITDLMMPEMSGIELLEKLREKAIAVPTIMVTGYPTIRTAMQALRLGAVDYVAKPFTRKELLGPVTRALCGHDCADDSVERRSADTLSLQPGSVLYLPNHSWARFEQNGLLVIGVEASFLGAVGSVTAITTPPTGESVEQGMAGITLANERDEQHAVAMPLTGVVEDRNEAALAAPADLSPDTWLLRLRPSDFHSELEGLVVRD